MLMLLAGGCASDGPAPPAPVTLYVDPDARSNDGKLFYMVIRNVNDKQFIDDNYDAVAMKAFPSVEDPALLAVHPIFPGEKKSVTITGPVKGTIAIYMMLTNPGSYWRSKLELPLDDGYTIELSDQNRLNVDSEPGWFSRTFFY